MKAAVVCANEDVRYMDYEEPVPGPGEVKVRVMASGICGSDIPRVLNHGVHFYPIVLGHEFSGYVTEVGEGVTKVKAGDHVTCAPLQLHRIKRTGEQRGLCGNTGAERHRI